MSCKNGCGSDYIEDMERRKLPELNRRMLIGAWIEVQSKGGDRWFEVDMYKEGEDLFCLRVPVELAPGNHVVTVYVDSNEIFAHKLYIRRTPRVLLEIWEALDETGVFVGYRTFKGSYAEYMKAIFASGEEVH
jgi:hypothetical protein